MFKSFTLTKKDQIKERAVNMMEAKGKFRIDCSMGFGYSHFLGGNVIEKSLSATIIDHLKTDPDIHSVQVIKNQETNRKGNISLLINHQIVVK